VAELREQFRDQLSARAPKKADQTVAKARTWDSMQVVGKLTRMVDGKPRIVADPPLVVPAGDLVAADANRARLQARLMQAASDIFLGWHHGRLGPGTMPYDFYIRQLRDWKASADIAGMTPAGMRAYGELCGWSLARAHARSGDRITIAAYLGRSTVFDQAIGEFAAAYADQNERGYRALAAANKTGRVVAERGV